MKYSATKAACILAATAGGAASAASMVQTGSLPMRATDWAQTVLIDRFDTEGGTRELTAVNWTVTGHIIGQAEIESLDASATTILVTLGSSVRLFIDDELAATANPSVAESFDAAAFDGTIDFGGASGTVIGPRIAQASGSGSAIDFSPFVGGGSVALTMDAFGSSFTTGSGNVLVGLSTSAAIEYRVEYVFNEVPTPGAAAMLGMAALTVLRRRR